VRNFKPARVQPTLVGHKIKNEHTMKKILLLFVVLFLVTNNNFTQDYSSIEDELIKNLRTKSSAVIIEENTSIISQFGDSNTGIINQFQAKYGNLGNYANVYQDGDFNTAILYQYGILFLRLVRIIMLI
jgi:hypothetical protein